MRDYLKSKPVLGGILMTIAIVVIVVGFIINNLIMIGIATILIIVIFYPELKNPENYKKIEKSVRNIWRT